MGVELDGHALNCITPRVSQLIDGGIDGGCDEGGSFNFLPILEAEMQLLLGETFLHKSE